jgi:hypothetical protein
VDTSVSRLSPGNVYLITTDGLVSQEDPHLTVQAFIELIQRHEQAFYNFVHKVHSKGEGLFDSLMRWIELFLTFVREGLGDPISLEFLLPHAGQERVDILAEVDKIAQYHYKLKVLYEHKIRRRFGRAQSSEADVEDEATQALVNGVIGEISFGDLVTGDAIDLAAEESDEESSSDECSSSEYETGSEDESDGTESSPENVKGKQSLPTPPLSPMSPQDRSNRQSRNHPRHDITRFQPHHPVTSSTSVVPLQAQLPPKRKRSFSLHRSTSMTFSMSNLSLSRRSQEVPAVPPVPPLPANLRGALPTLSKPLPPAPLASPTLSDSPDTPPLISSKLHPQSQQPQPPRPTGPPKPAILKKKTKAPEPTLKPPDLHHVPLLLPVFVEMVGPILLMPVLAGFLMRVN